MKESRRSSLRATAIQSEPRIAAQVRIASVSLKPVRPRRAACVYGKAEGPFHPKGPAGGWCGTGSGELWIFLPRNRIICQVENSLYLDRSSAMNASSTELHRKIRRTAGRASSEAGGMRSGGVQNAAEKGRLKEKNL